jgi:hypothetical protein
MTPIPCSSAKGKNSFSMARRNIEYGGCRLVMGAIFCARFICYHGEIGDADPAHLALLLEPRQRLPTLFEFPSGSGQWIW